MYLIASQDTIDVEWRKEKVIGMVVFLLLVGSYILPIVFYAFVLKEKVANHDPSGAWIRVTILTLLIISFASMNSIKIFVEDYIDPHAERKRRTERMISEIQRRKELEVKKVISEIEGLDKIQTKLSELNASNSLCDYDKLDTFISDMREELLYQDQMISSLALEIDTIYTNSKQYYEYVDSIYKESQLINDEVSTIVKENTWYKKEKYIDYIISFLLGILANIVYTYFRSKYLTKRNQMKRE